MDEWKRWYPGSYPRKRKPGKNWRAILTPRKQTVTGPRRGRYMPDDLKELDKKHKQSLNDTVD